MGFKPLKQIYSPPNEMKPISPFGLELIVFAKFVSKKLMGLKLREASHISLFGIDYCYLIVNHRFNFNIIFHQLKEAAAGGFFFRFEICGSIFSRN